MKYKKITIGYVIQDYEDKDDKYLCSSQTFIAGDEVSRENDIGESVKVDNTNEIYEPFEMVQPHQPSYFVMVESVSGAEVGSQFEATDAETALRKILEEMGYSLMEI